MEIFNLGIPELLFILIIMLIIWGPTEMANNARKMARFVRKITQSETWRMVRETTNELRELPNQLVREAALEEWEQNNPPIRPGEHRSVPMSAERDNGSQQTIQPPVDETPPPAGESNPEQIPPPEEDLPRRD